MTPTPLPRAAAITERGFAGPSKKLQRAGRVEQIGDALHRRRSRASAQDPDDRVRVTDACYTPGADQPLANQLFKSGPNLGDKGVVWGHAVGGVGPARDMPGIRHHVRMEEEQVEPRQAQSLQAAFDRLAQHRLDLGARCIAETAFAGDPHTCRQPAAKGFADDLFGLAVAIARSEIDQIDPGRYRLMHRGDTFLERRFAPHHAEPAAAQGQGRDRP